MPKTLPFAKNKLHSAVVFSLFAGVSPLSSLVMADPAPLCSGANAVINNSQMGASCVLDGTQNLTIEGEGVVDRVVIPSETETVATTINNAGSVTNLDPGSFGIGILNSTVTLDINNTGTISVGEGGGEGEGEGSVGILLVDSSADSVININNSGSITSTNAIAALNSSGDLNITNTGSLVANTDDGDFDGDFNDKGIGIRVEGSDVTGNIVNDVDGDITADYIGILVIDDSEGEGAGGAIITGDIVNNGTIQGLLGVAIGDSEIGNVTNSGTIEGSITAVAMYGASFGSVTNNGDIVADKGIAIQIDGSTGRGVVNEGSIVSGDTGIEISDGILTEGVANNGSIVTGGAGIELNDVTFDSITNGIDGSIVSEGEGGEGISLNNSDGSSLSNQGSINTDGFGIYVSSSTLSDGITNDGTISADIGILVSGASSTSITNTGTVTGTSFAIIAGSSEGIVINNSGTINGDINLGNSTLNVSGGAINGEVEGFAGSTVNFTGDFATNGDFWADEINIQTGATLTLTDTLHEAKEQLPATVHNYGTLYVPAGEVGTIDDAYIQDAAGILKIGLASAESYGKLAVNYSATFASDAKIDVNVMGAPELVVGETIADVVTAEGGITSDGTFSVLDNSALFNFTGVLDGDTIDLLIESGVTVLDAVQLNTNSPAVGAAMVIDQLIADGTTDEDLQSLITALGKLETEAEVSAAVSQLLPLLTGNQVTALVGAVGEISKVVQSRIEGLYGMSSGDVPEGEQQHQMFTDTYLWLKGFGSKADQDSVDSINGFDADTSGFVIGVDGILTGNDRIGLAFAYAQTDVDSKDNLNNAEIKSYQLLGYGSHSLDNDTQFSYQASYGVHQSEGSRNILLMSDTATSDFDSTSLSVGVGLLRGFTINDQLTITPSIRSDYSYMDNDGYTEKGAGSLNLIVDDNDAEQWLFSVDGKAVYRLTDNFSLRANAGASYDVINEKSSATSALAGSPINVFTTEGLQTDAWLYNAGVGFVMETEHGAQITARYDYSTRDDFDNQTLSIKARMAF